MAIQKGAYLRLELARLENPNGVDNVGEIRNKDFGFAGRKRSNQIGNGNDCPPK